MTEHQILTVEETAALLRISRWSLYNLIRSGRLRTITVGRRRLIPAQALADCLAQLQEEAAA